jgi:hypothetical protein
MSDGLSQLAPGRQCDGHGADAGCAGRFKFKMIQRGDFIKPGWWH